MIPGSPHKLHFFHKYGQLGQPGEFTESEIHELMDPETEYAFVFEDEALDPQNDTSRTYACVLVYRRSEEMLFGRFLGISSLTNNRFFHGEEYPLIEGEIIPSDQLWCIG